MNRAVLHRLGLLVGIAIALTGCEQPPRELGWLDVPQDPQVYAFVLNQCLSATRGPMEAHYNDWDEAIAECRRSASIASSYCPTGARCSSNMRVTRADVRAILGAAQ